MNVLWRYVDQLVGKGLSVGVLIQFFYYSALTLSPTALPLAVLLASLITFGNFGERYELTAMKTAGISLLRVMRPLLILCLVLAGVSFYFQNVTCPNASKKLMSLIYSMQQKSPELEIPEGAFYDEIAGYNLYVKHKNTKTGWLYDVKIYDVSQGFEDIKVIAADSGRLETTADKQHLYLHLFDGEQFENMQAQNMTRKNNPYRREIFAEKHILIDFDSDFNLVDENLMNSKAASKNMTRIRHDIDSLSLAQDSLGLGNLDDFRAAAFAALPISKNDSSLLDSCGLRRLDVDSVFAYASSARQVSYRDDMQSRIQRQASELVFKANSMYQGDRNIRLHWIEWMRKITLCLSVLIFFFIGAPLGAIIRKGGLGVPVIVSVFTYILYYLTSVSGEKMFKEGEWSVVGCWLSTILLASFSTFFTVTANKDSSIFQWDAYKEFFRHWFGGKVRRNITCKEVVMEEPDVVACMNLCRTINVRAAELSAGGTARLVPGYFTLFFGRCASDLESLTDDVECLVEMMSNSRDRVELDILNGFPVVPIYALEAPFANRTVNRIIGLLFPLGLLFWLRTWLFGIVISRQLNDIVSLSEKLIRYCETGRLEKIDKI